MDTDKDQIPPHPCSSVSICGSSLRSVDPIVDISGLTYAYPGAGDRIALKDLNLQVQTGELFGFLGPNGSGKTTLFRILSTLITPPPATVRIFGFDPAKDRDAIRREI